MNSFEKAILNVNISICTGTDLRHSRDKLLLELTVNHATGRKSRE